MDPQKIMFPNLPERIRGLEELAENLWWCWNPEGRMLFKMIDRQAWKESGHNPDKMLREISAEVLAGAAKDAEYLRHYDLVLSRFQQYLAEKECFILDDLPASGSPAIAYFSAEYGLHRSLPFYAGGLGFLAGDFIKECSDMNVPLLALGFMYPGGYLHQHINQDGWQEDIEQPLNRDAAAISRVWDQNGEHLVVKVPLIDPPIYVAVWKVSAGRVPLYLLDTDTDRNEPVNRGISARLYMGDMEQRLRQEIVLGIGGSEVLDALGIQHSVLHLNEGHPAFALLERIRDLVQGGMSYEEASDQVRKTSVFTTHTPVPAGHDVFPFHLMEKYFHSYWPSLGLDRDQFFQLGAHPDKPEEGFNMTVFALRMTGYRNGVSRRHGEVARRMWHSLWPDVPEDQTPIDHITNGVHVPTWIEPKMQLLFNKYLGPKWLEEHDNPLVWEFVDDIPDEELWKIHHWLKIKLIDDIHGRARRVWTDKRVNASAVLAGGTLLNHSVLTLGFARRFATYKRADLIFYDTERLKKLLNDRWRPVQIIFAGKAHPADDPGKRMLQRIFNAARDPEMGGRIAFVEGYGEQLAQYLVHGVDVWLNNPIPPMEASGTSGMKAALNGVPHLSLLDGWWPEGYDGKNGWAVEHTEADNDPNRKDAECIYRLLEDEIVPRFYRLSNDGIPRDWVRVMKESIKSNAPKFSSRRMVKEYIRKFYAEAIKNTG
ncbi:MAG: alpha-glucan family phosphorylase [Desulfobacterales bacterium]|nr:alpha-glucan family phosphorylase [Desulfobacterales bacterium]